MENIESTETSVTKINYEPIVPDFGPFKLLEDIISNNNGQFNQCDIEGFEMLSSFLNSGEFLNILKLYLTSPDFKDDYKPLIQQLIDYDRTYHLIDKDLIFSSLSVIDDVDTIISHKDRVELLKQQELFDFIPKEDYQIIPDTFKLTDYLNTEQIKILLTKQSTFYTRVPTIDDLTLNGVLPEIFNRIKEIYFSKTETVNTINKILSDRARLDVFLTREQLEKISNNPSTINTELSLKEYRELLNRHISQLSFITQEMITNLDIEIYPNLGSNEIQVIIEKEISNKKLSQEILTPSDIINVFNEKNEELFDKQKELLINETKDYIDGLNIGTNNSANSKLVTIENVIEIFNQQKDLIRENIIKEIKETIDLEINVDCFISITNEIIQEWINEEIIEFNKG